MFITRNIPEQKYFADIKRVTVTADSPDLSDSVTELAYAMLKSFTPHMGITIEEGNILAYISGYICYIVSRSACDQCKVILMPIINCIHFCLRSNNWIFRVWGFCSTSIFNAIKWFKWTNFRNIPEQILRGSYKRDLIITFIKDSKSNANCECFTLILHIYVPIRLHHVLLGNNEHYQ